MRDMADHGRYLGKPDLELTAAMVAAGGGPRHFEAVTLLRSLAAEHRDAEFASLDERFGARRVAQFAKTFDTFVDRALGIAAHERLTFPKPSPLLTRDPSFLSASLYHAGVMPDGRFDIGYMLEHLLSRPMHKELMDEVNADPAFGPAVNADFHVILTAVMNHLNRLYGVR
jgi:hypothetical protein